MMFIFILKLVRLLNVVAVSLMLCSGYISWFNPITHARLACLGLAFPVLLAINACFLLFWLLIKVKFVWITLVGFLLCLSPIRQYFPINIPRKAPEGCIKVLSYNVWLFASWMYDNKLPNPIVDYILREDPDILCLQEADLAGLPPEKVYDRLKVRFPHYSLMSSAPGGSTNAVFSKYPILSAELINIRSRSNLAMACKLDINGQKVTVVNVHLESIGFTNEDKQNFKQIIKQPIAKRKNIVPDAQSITDKLTKAFAIRSEQADCVLSYLNHKAEKSVIVCGDFNDSPVSYAQRTVGKNLTDCYRASANGLGISYHQGGFFVRIDHIMCSKDWKPYECHVDNSIKISDHYPILCKLQKDKE